MDNEILINITYSLAGFIIGNRLVIGRDKRKEFNSVTRDAREVVKAQINAIHIRNHHIVIISDEYFLEIYDHLSWYKKIRLKKLALEYSLFIKNNSSIDNCGDFVISNIDKIPKILLKILDIIKMK